MNVEDIVKSRIKEGNVFNGRREELISLFAELGFTKGAEIGVKKANYSLFMCQNIPNLELICVDPWTGYGSTGPGGMERLYQRSVEILSPYNVKIIRDTSVGAAKLVPDNSLDFVYIDAAHDFDNVMVDIILWSQKVRVGGIVSGHDYVDIPSFGVVQAVDIYTEIHKVGSFYITLPEYHRKLPVPSWFWVKK